MDRAQGCGSCIFGLSGPGKLHEGSCLDAGNLQIHLKVRARGEDIWRKSYSYNKLVCSQGSCEENLSFLVPVVQAGCLSTSAVEDGHNKERCPFL